MSETKTGIERFLTDMVRHSGQIVIKTPETAKAAYMIGQVINKICNIYSIDEVGIYQPKAIGKKEGVVYVDKNCRRV